MQHRKRLFVLSLHAVHLVTAIALLLDDASDLQFGRMLYGMIRDTEPLWLLSRRQLFYPAARSLPFM